MERNPNPVPDESPSFAEERAAQEPALRLVAKREHSLVSLFELSHELTVLLDSYEIADLALFNLMGHFGTPKAVIWIEGRNDAVAPVPIRRYGVSERVVPGLSNAWIPDLLRHLDEDPKPFLLRENHALTASSGSRLAENSGLVLFAPIRARGQRIGIVGLGAKMKGESYSPVDLLVLEASLGMVGVALQNAQLYNRNLEHNRQLRMANENLEQLDRLKSEFLQNVNHELRTPLTIILAYVDSLLTHEDMSEPSQKSLRVILDQAEHLKRMVLTLLDTSAALRSRLGIRTTTEDLRQIVQAYFQERRPGVVEGLREFRLDDGNDNELFARFDTLRTLQVLDALLDNAIKFTPQGTEITLRVSSLREDGRGWGVVQVSDNGPGLPEDRLPTLFEPFRQGDGSMTRTIGGMGLGLTLARQLSREMGGDLRVKSELGGGTEFTLLLPLARRASDRRAA